MNLKDKIVIVTGSTKGIGKEIALEFGRCGAKVVVSGRNEERANEVCEEIRAAGGEAAAVIADVSKMDDAQALIDKTAETFGRIDVLVNNAGITRDNLIMRMKEEDWNTVVDINLKGTFNCVKSITRLMMKQRGGKIINITSVVGQIGNAGQVNYSASKAGIIGLTKSVAKELATRGITCNAIAPGFIETDMTDVLDEKTREGLLTQIPLNRLGSVSDIARVTTFLASDAADYITGQTINVDGGMVMI